MKKNLKLRSVIYIILVLTIVNMLTGCTSSAGNVDKKYGTGVQQLINTTQSENKTRILNYDEVKDSLIRFHVIANSDNEDDQNLKIKVKDKVIDYLYPYLNKSESLEESRQIIKEKMDDVKKIAEDVIKKNNYTYGVKLELSRENFPDKSYGNIVLPQGNYEAFRIIIGDGAGKNWWCVMFPPLCFVDESKAEVEYDKTEEKIKAEQDKSKNNENVSETEKLDGKNTENNIQIKFKIVEVIKKLFN